MSDTPSGPWTGTRAKRVPAPGGPHARLERGAATAETVMVLPLLAALALGLAWLLSLAATQVRVVDAAREVARAVARDEGRDASVGLGRRVAPEGSDIAVRDQGDVVLVRVSSSVDGPRGLFAFLPDVHVHAEAVAAKEQR